jgi:hypothetical protein
MFEAQLPPEYRGKAIRELFYQTEGEDPTEEEQKEKATKIIDSINLQRRNTTIKRVAEIKVKEQAATDEGIKSFNTTDEADNSGLPKDTIVLVGGRRYQL